MPFIRAHGKQKRARGRWAAKGLLERHSVAPFVTRATNGTLVDSCIGRVPTLRFVSFEASFQAVPFAAEKILCLQQCRSLEDIAGSSHQILGLGEWTMDKKKKRRKRRAFTPEFKTEGVRLCRVGTGASRLREDLKSGTD